MRELLKEAREILGDCYYHGKEPLSDGTRAKIAKTIKRIEAALAEPEPDAMEILRKVREEGQFNDGTGKKIPPNSFALPDSEAVALIESYGRRAPGAMLEEIYQEGYATGYTQPMRNTKSQDIERIADKYGVQVEG